MLILAALHGCASVEHCSDQQFFKAFVDGHPNPNRYFPGVADLKLNEDVILKVTLCNRESTGAICVEIYPAENVSFQFSEPRLTVSRKVAETTTNLPIKKVTYNIICHGPTLSEADADCQSSTASPIVGSARLDRDRQRTQKIGANYYYVDACEFPPDAAFKGATVSATFLTKFRRKYVAVTEPFRPQPDDEYIVSIPPVRIGGQTWAVPQASFKYVAENVCLPNRPLSLQ